MMPEILIADPDAPLYAERLHARLPAIEWRAVTDAASLRDLIGSADALVSFGLDLDAAMVESAPRLRWVQCLGTGVDRLLAHLDRRPDILLTSARGVHGPPVAEMALMLMLALARRLPTLLDHQRERTWRRPAGQLLFGSTLGIAGMGVIGAALAERARVLGMDVVGFGSAERAVPGLKSYRLYADLPAIAPDLDWLVILTPMTEDTKGLFNETLFRSMKRSAYLVNLARGAVVDDGALAAALSGSEIAGAALDVFASEPLPPDSPFWSMHNVIVTPHVAGAHDRYIDFVLPIIEQNARAFLSGRTGDMINMVARSPAAHSPAPVPKGVPGHRRDDKVIDEQDL